MIGLLQRVSCSAVSVGGVEVGRIGPGLAVLLGIQRGDAEREADRLLQRILSYRVFADEAGRMNRSLSDVGGGLLLVPQFTLAADTRKGTRASFSAAATPAEGQRLFGYVCARAAELHSQVAWGRFAADMQVMLINDGPVTFWLEVAPAAVRAP